ncbi:MAG: hypothetical protein ACRDRW_08515, partial [Pseudonocardiaceae bacterium]
MSTRGGAIVLDPLAVTALVLASVLVTNGGLDAQRPARGAHPVGGVPRWGVSSLDWRSHAVDGDADHPYGVYVARCG